MVTLTEAAKQYLKSICDGGYVSLGVKSGGCSGFEYVWDFKKNWPDVNWSDPIDDVLVLDPMAELYILGSTIDYVTELAGSFLAVKNPSASMTCGCGDSFGV
jgi:iron-sulfur cluster assembly accessory protein